MTLAQTLVLYRTFDLLTQEISPVGSVIYHDSMQPESNLSMTREQRAFCAYSGVTKSSQGGMKKRQPISSNRSSRKEERVLVCMRANISLCLCFIWDQVYRGPGRFNRHPRPVYPACSTWPHGDNASFLLQPENGC